MARVDREHMTTLRTAAESRATAASALDDVQLEAAAYAINNAANCGQYNILFQEEMRPNTKQQLESKGYELQVDNVTELKKTTLISWKQ